MRSSKLFVPLTLGGALALITAAPRAFAQGTNPDAANNSVTGSGNGIGSAGTNAPNVKVNGPYSPSHPPHYGSVHDSKTIPPAAGGSDSNSFSSASEPLSAKPGHPGGHGVKGSSQTGPGE
jgi:hypothetical protein